MLQFTNKCVIVLRGHLTILIVVYTSYEICSCILCFSGCNIIYSLHILEAYVAYRYSVKLIEKMCILFNICSVNKNRMCNVNS